MSKFKTRTAYIQQIEELDDLLSRLGETVVSAIRATSHALGEGDKGAARGVIDGRGAANRLRRSVEDSCMGLMLLQQPLAGDLRLVTASFRMVSDLARIEEMAIDIAQLSIEIDEHTIPATITGELAMLAAQVATMVESAVDAFNRSDENAAVAVFPLDDEVDTAFRKVRDMITDALRSGGQCADEAPELLMIAKYYERMGDHAQQVADWAIFRATGLYRGRPMGEDEFDQTEWTQESE
jgi:phosphate transport system protein